MSVLLLGLSHKTAPVEVRERFAVAESSSPERLTALAGRPGISEAVILSTCNRVELLVQPEAGSDPTEEILSFLGSEHRSLADEVKPYFYRYVDQDAIRHIFRVASSLDSMVLGEPQILGQIKDAYASAKKAGTIRGELDFVLNHAFRVARRVRNETGIGQMAVSVSYVAVELARKIFGDLNGRSILIIGAGKMSELAAKHLRRAGGGKVYVTNRTHERAEELAKVFDGQAVEFGRLLEWLTRVDIVITSTGSRNFILTKETAEGVIAARRQRPVFFVDIAVPRDIDPAINSIDNMFVYDIDDLQHVADANLDQRRREAERGESIVEEELSKLMHRLKTHQVAPTIVSLQDELERMRRAELERFRSKLGDLTSQQEQAVEALTRSMVGKIAHSPISQMKKLASHPDGLHFVEFVKRAFNLHK
jgi:glutamyl-tRNA reductase